MIRIWPVLAVAACALLPATVAAQTGDASSPARRGSPQRAAILNAVRPAVEADLRTQVQFLVRCIQVHNGQAIVTATPQRRGGGAIDRRVINDWENRDGLTVTAIMQFRAGRWALVDHAIGATDVWYEAMVPRTLTVRACS